MKTILVTGGAGFIGSNYIRHVLDTTRDVRIVNVDALTYAGNLENLAGVDEDPRYRFLKADILDLDEHADTLREGGVSEVVHFAAESHVDRSIADPSAFLRTNVLGTQAVIGVCQKLGVDRMVHVSTDEVYGSLAPDAPAFAETHALEPNSPYAASKASSDLLVRAAHHTHGFPGVITRCSNNYGPYQFPEKLMPLMIVNALEDRPLPVYGDGQNVRDWIHVRDHARAIELVRRGGRPGAVYNIGGNSERKNLDVVKAILAALGKPESLIRFVDDRPGHDRRYAIDGALIARELGFVPEWGFEEGVRDTVSWYRSHQAWWERVRSLDYRAYYQEMYGRRLNEK